MDRARAIEVLTQHNKWRRDSNVPNSIPMVNTTELGDAIDFAIKDMIGIKLMEEYEERENNKKALGFLRTQLEGIETTINYYNTRKKEIEEEIEKVEQWLKEHQSNL